MAGDGRVWISRFSGWRFRIHGSPMTGKASRRFGPPPDGGGSIARELEEEARLPIMGKSIRPHEGEGWSKRPRMTKGRFRCFPPPALPLCQGRREAIAPSELALEGRLRDGGEALPLLVLLLGDSELGAPLFVRQNASPIMGEAFSAPPSNARLRPALRLLLGAPELSGLALGPEAETGRLCEIEGVELLRVPGASIARQRPSPPQSRGQTIGSRSFASA
ncbi:hypothetical protein AMST5_04091 [freshwater sediment metagenome]|uniref:Uncharacterized protein n=1 Tax=freshwater sediment metagenome TaxID=556182 RepID=A0AA48M370_9ZZZZ